jgi:hypothetical protein
VARSRSTATEDTGAAASIDTTRRCKAVAVERGSGSRSRTWRVVGALLVGVGGVVAIAVVAASIGRGDTDEPGVSVSAPGEAIDAVVMALLTFGLALTIAFFVVQFGGERKEDPQDRRRRLIGALLLPIVLVGMLWLLREAGLSFDLGEPDAQVGQPLDVGSGSSATDEPPDAASADRSTVGSWTGIAFGLLLVLVGAWWMWGERRRRGMEQALATSDDERDGLVARLDVAIDDLRSDPDPRRAVVRAWQALGDALAIAGLPREDAEAPFPYLERALAALETSGPAATSLTSAFERALFAPGSVDRETQLDAVDALVAVRDELRVVSR